MKGLLWLGLLVQWEIDRLMSPLPATPQLLAWVKTIQSVAVTVILNRIVDLGMRWAGKRKVS